MNAVGIAKKQESDPVSGSFNADSDSIAGIAAMGMQALKLYYDTEESREGVRAFNEMRKPDFRKHAK